MRREITINEPFESRTAHTSVTCTSEPVRHVFDDAELGKGPANALLKTIVEQLKTISAPAKQATIERRQRAAKALARGVRSAVQRYGSKPPTGTSTRLFNDSGHLADLVLRAAGDAWEIIAPGDRLGGSDLAPGALARIMQRLRELVPALRAPLDQPAVRDAIERSVGRIFGR